MNAQPKMPPRLRQPGQHSTPGNPMGQQAARQRGPNSRLDHLPPRDKGEDVFQIIRQLNDLLMKENVALKKHRVQDVQVLGQRKQDLARLYQQQMNAFHRNPKLLQDMDESKRNALIQAAARLTELMKDNASLLKANIQVINSFMKSVVDSVREKQERKSTSYSKEAQLDGHVTVKRHMAVSFNEVT